MSHPEISPEYSPVSTNSRVFSFNVYNDFEIAEKQ